MIHNQSNVSESISSSGYEEDDSNDRYPQSLIRNTYRQKKKLFGNTKNKKGSILEKIQIISNGSILNNLNEMTHVKLSLINNNYNVSSDLLDNVFGSPSFASTLSYINAIPNNYLHGHHYPVIANFKLTRIELKSQSHNRNILMYDRADWSKFKTVR